MSLIPSLFSDPFLGEERESDWTLRPFRQMNQQLAKASKPVNLRMELKEHDNNFSLIVDTPGLSKV